MDEGARKTKAEGGEVSKQEQFEAEVDALQERIGYRFKDRKLLIQALTDPSFARLFTEGTAANPKLEYEGDGLLKTAVEVWTETHFKDASPVKKKYLHDVLNSNFYLSTIGMRLSLQEALRTSTRHSRAQGAEDKIRFTSDLVEALIGAIDQDGGEEARDAFVRSHILPDSPEDERIRDFVLLASEKTPDIQEAFSRLTRGRGALMVGETDATLDARHSGQHFVARILLDEEPVESRGRRGKTLPLQRYGGIPSEVALKAATLFFRENPWILWDFDGPASVIVPNASSTKQGEPFMSHFVPRRWRSEESVGTLAQQLEQGLAEQSVFPPIEEHSTETEGPYLDQLRLRLHGHVLSAFTREGDKAGLHDYYFFKDGEYLFGVFNKKNIDKAARAVMEELYPAR